MKQMPQEILERCKNTTTNFLVAAFMRAITQRTHAINQQHLTKPETLILGF